MQQRISDVEDAFVDAHTAMSLARRLHAIVSNATDAIISIDAHQRITLFNRAAEQIFGHAAHEMIGRSLEVLLPSGLGDTHRCFIAQMVSMPDTDGRQMGRSARTVRACRSNGELFPIEASISKVTIGDEVHLTVILRDVSDRERASTELDAARREIARLSAIAHVAREGEQRRLAQQLHENLAQDLAAVKFALAALTGVSSGEASELRDQIGAMSAQLDVAMATARRIASELQPLLLGDLGLRAALEWLVDGFHKRTRTRCTLVPRLDLDRLDRTAATLVFRVVQEALDNVAEHSQARRARVELREAGDGASVCLLVCDDGDGFDPADVPAAAVGLIEVGDRLRVLGGELEIESKPGAGTTLRARLPFRLHPLEAR